MTKAQIRFSVHALDRAVERFLPGMTNEQANQILIAEFHNGDPTKLAAGQHEERWLLKKPACILVCVWECGELVVKTILRNNRASASLALAETTPDDVNRDGEAVLEVNVKYLRSFTATHGECLRQLEETLRKHLKGTTFTKNYTTIEFTVTSRAIKP